jgi:hypothetical protein
MQSKQPRTTLPSESSATPNICGSGTRASRIWAAGRSERNSSTNGPMPLLSRLSPQVHDERIVADEVLADQDGVRQASASTITWFVRSWYR